MYVIISSTCSFVVVVSLSLPINYPLHHFPILITSFLSLLLLLYLRFCLISSHPHIQGMENERAGLHELKLADLREQLREANRTIASLKESEKERTRLAEKLKDRDTDVSKVSNTLPHPTPPHLTSPHLTSPHLTSPTSPHTSLTSPHLTSPHLTFTRHFLTPSLHDPILLCTFLYCPLKSSRAFTCSSRATPIHADTNTL